MVCAVFILLIYQIAEFVEMFHRLSLFDQLNLQYYKVFVCIETYLCRNIAAWYAIVLYTCAPDVIIDTYSNSLNGKTIYAYFGHRRSRLYWRRS